jgi:hypothetical protein
MFGDVNGNGDDEAFMLRELPANDNRARLIGRNRSTDPLALTEDPLDFASAYLHGATGDIDGDGKDEVILVGRGKFRYYLTPDTSASATEEAVSTNQRTLLAGDLDAAGYLQELILQPSTTVATSSTPAGGQAPPVTVNILNGTNNQPIQFSAQVQGSAPWMTLSVGGTQTPATLTVTFDSTRLPQATYLATVLLTSPNPLVYTQPVSVLIQLIVGPGVLLQPDGLAFVRADCEMTPTVESQTVLINAPAGSAYTVSIVQVPGAESAGAAQVAAPAIDWPSGAAWVSAQSATGIAPEPLTITVDYAQRSSDLDQARAIVSAVVNGATIVRMLPITLFCAGNRALLPLVDH